MQLLMALRKLWFSVLWLVLAVCTYGIGGDNRRDWERAAELLSNGRNIEEYADVITHDYKSETPIVGQDFFNYTDFCQAFTCILWSTSTVKFEV